MTETFESEVTKLGGCDLKSLMAAYSRKRGKFNELGATSKSKKPKISLVKTKMFDRDPLVVAIGKARALSKCEIAECTHALFIDGSGKGYCEVQHIDALSEGGLDEIENVICLCPSHHREAHFGADSKVLKEKFIQIRRNSSH
jgi:predicted HNH restriction endonuclease